MGNFCEKYPELIPYINFCAYTELEIALVFLGTAFWVITYVIIIRDGFKNKFVEMPVAAAAANVAWEFVWAFVYTTDMGSVFVWGLRIWFFLDLLIIYNLFRFGAKQLDTPVLIKNFPAAFAGGILMWVFIFYYFIGEGYDTPMGATSAYVITPLMSFWYVTLFSWKNKPELFSYLNAWCRMIGDLLMTVFVFLHYPEMQMVQFLAVTVFIFDCWYIFVFFKKRLTNA